ncbi:nuclear transport factor 2 family protein [Nonomuraea sp. NPDC049625]|uniref:nuclear transport factor 2 family protein n=1 Tax=Nonomuraea sp. NPDC049625 TaxID=3155775 RepID=UPI003416A62F
MTTRLLRGRWTVATSLAACALLASACGTTPATTPAAAPSTCRTAGPATSPATSPATGRSTSQSPAAEESISPGSATCPASGSEADPGNGDAGSPSRGRGALPSAATGGHAGVAREVRAYVDAVNARDLDALVAAFASDGVVVDVTRPIRGHDAIREWARAEVIGGTLKVVSIAERRSNGQKLLVHWAPAGSGGWRAHYDFTVSDGRIVRADLQYA